jgi:thiol-disulfide isomerase/thioredoxin
MKKTSNIIKNIVKLPVIVIGIVIGIALIPGCDIVEEPYLVQVGDNDTNGTGVHFRKVLLEDYTGQKCPNCPEAAEIAHNLQTIYGDKVVVIALHAGFYSVPEETGNFTADYRTSVGNDLNAYFAFPAYPMGMVNRTAFSGSTILLKDSWESAVEAQLELDPEASIEITNTYFPSDRKLDCTVETEFLTDKEGIYNICVFVMESLIVSPQQTEGGVVTDYVHNHMLRASMNGTWGELVGADGSAVNGVKVSNSYTMNLPAGWNDVNCAVVAFVYNNETLEVVQAEEEAF